MSTTLSTLAQTKTQQTQQKPQLVLVIDGVDQKFGVGSIKKYARIGDPGLEIGDDWVIGGFTEENNQLDAISLDGSSTTIAQQLLQDRGGATSVSSVSISLLDVGGEITRLITPGEVVDDILGRKAKVYLGYQDTAFPEDFVKIFAGIIDEIGSGPTIILNVASPEQAKRGQVAIAIKTTLTSDLRFRSETIQGILYKTHRAVVGSVTVTYANTATAGSETVSVIGNAITIGIQSGVSTASQVRKAINNSLPALTLVDIDILDGETGTLQTTQGPTTLGSDTTINVEDTNGLILPAASEGLRTYVRIDDEIIEYTGLTSTTITGCTREAFVETDQRTQGDHHDSGTEVTSFYRLQGDPVELALKLMISGGPTYYDEDRSVKSVNVIEEVGTVQDAVYFEGINIQDEIGVVSGDLATMVDQDNPANNFTDQPVAEIFKTDFGSYITFEGLGLVDSPISSATISFKSKWNLWPAEIGLGLGGDSVDVPEFEIIRETFSSSLFDYDFYITDTINVKDFIDTEVLYPSGAFTLPRKGKISLGFTSPPLGAFDLKVFDSSNTIKPEQNKIYRGIARYFYNNVVYRFNESVLDSGKLLSGELTVSADSKSRIQNVGNKTLVIDARGVRPSAETTQIIDRLTQRFLDRYKFGAERIKIQGFYGDSFNTDVGDIFAFGGADLKLPNSKTGTRGTGLKLYEVVNKSLDIRSGLCSFDLVDTAYSLDDGRFGVISPASIVGTGSTTSSINLVNSYGNTPPKKEKVKWSNFIGLNVMIHEEDSDGIWTSSYVRKLAGFAPSNGNVMLLDPPLPSPPAEGAIVSVPDYPDNTDPEDSPLYKQLFVFTDPVVAVTSGVNNFSFNVSSGDATKFQEKQPLILHKENSEGIWVSQSNEVKVLSVAGTLITVDKDMGLTPDNTFKVGLIGFPDGGSPYRFLG